MSTNKISEKETKNCALKLTHFLLIKQAFVILLTSLGATKYIAEYFNKPDHTLKNLRLAVIKKVKGATKQLREAEEEKIIFKFNGANKGSNRDYSFMSHYL